MFKFKIASSAVGVSTFLISFLCCVIQANIASNIYLTLL